MFSRGLSFRKIKLGPDRNSGSGGIWAGSGSVDLAGTRLVPLDYNRYSLKSENVEMLLFMNYNLRYLNFRY